MTGLIKCTQTPIIYPQKMIMGPEHSGKHDRYIKRFLRTGEARVLGQQRELEAKRRDGSFFPMILGVTEVSIPGNAEGSRMFAAYIHDLTERQKVVGKSSSFDCFYIGAKPQSARKTDNLLNLLIISSQQKWKRRSYFSSTCCLKILPSGSRLIMVTLQTTSPASPSCLRTSLVSQRCPAR